MNTEKTKWEKKTLKKVARGDAEKDGKCKKTHIRLPPIRTRIHEECGWIVFRLDIPRDSNPHFRRHFFWEQYGKSNRVFAESRYLSPCAIRRCFRELHASPQQHGYTQRSISRCFRKLHQIPIRPFNIRRNHYSSELLSQLRNATTHQRNGLWKSYAEYKWHYFGNP